MARLQDRREMYCLACSAWESRAIIAGIEAGPVRVSFNYEAGKFGYGGKLWMKFFTPYPFTPDDVRIRDETVSRIHEQLLSSGYVAELGPDIGPVDKFEVIKDQARKLFVRK